MGVRSSISNSHTAFKPRDRNTEHIAHSEPELSREKRNEEHHSPDASTIDVAGSIQRRPQSRPIERKSLRGASDAAAKLAAHECSRGPCAEEERRGVGEPCTRSQHRSNTHLRAAGPPAPVFADRRHTLRRKLRLYFMPKIPHRGLGDRRSTHGL